MNCKQRMSLIHPLIPKGRDFTLRFSPSRRHLEAELSQSLCVCCAGDGTAKLVPLPSNICNADSSQSRHFAHENCLKVLERAESVKCPRCRDLESRSCMDSSYPHSVYCKDVVVSKGISGFKSTAKLEKVLEWAKSLPKNSKAIIFSFFEGALDLLEGALTEDLGIDCARHDNDLSPDNQASDLMRFKNSPQCKILLATVQSCGSGLNIEEANYIAFVDRWFDVTIHEQAISRCHNINQTKDVNVVYFDVAITVDEVRI
jgi:Superfamily II DNA/RNA helicases, SNF2 family